MVQFRTVLSLCSDSFGIQTQLQSRDTIFIVENRGIVPAAAKVCTKVTTSESARCRVQTGPFRRVSFATHVGERRRVSLSQRGLPLSSRTDRGDCPMHAKGPSGTGPQTGEPRCAQVLLVFRVKTVELFEYIRTIYVISREATAVFERQLSATLARPL
jgi:hypothetical protein